jgi:hypothetical protein
MAINNVIEPNRLTNMQEMEVHVNGPDGANRMFIYSGMAEVDMILKMKKSLILLPRPPLPVAVRTA